MQVEDWPLDRIQPYPGNPRQRSKKAVEKVAASIREFGPRQPIVVDEAGVILVGHTRRDAAALLAMPTFPVHQALGLSEAQKRAYRIADNRTNEETSWDEGLLAAELKTLEATDFTGFDLREVNGYLRGGPQPGEDDVPKPGPPVTQRGDLWTLGDHKVLCGDATSAEDVARVLGDAKPLLMVTDPPYGVQLDMEWRDRAGHNEMAPASRSYMKIAMNGHGISGDAIADWSRAFEHAKTVNVAYVWHATSHMLEVAEGLARIGFETRQQLIWLKTVAAMGRQAYHWKHEPCWYAVRKGSAAQFIGSRDQTTVWEAASPKHIMSGSKEEKWDHPTQKPVELMRRSIANHPGDVFEPFCGSGTTLIACETEGRRCFGLEIEPRYVDVIVARWEKFTGKQAVRESSEVLSASR